MQDLLRLAVTGTERGVQLEVIDVVQEGRANRKEYILKGKESCNYKSEITPSGGLETHPELAAVLELVKLRLQVQGLLQILQELALECHDLVDVAEQRVDLGVGEECLAFHGLQIVLQQIVQMLQGDNIISMKHKTKQAIYTSRDACENA